MASIGFKISPRRLYLAIIFSFLTDKNNKLAIKGEAQMLTGLMLALKAHNMSLHPSYISKTSVKHLKLIQPSSVSVRNPYISFLFLKGATCRSKVITICSPQVLVCAIVLNPILDKTLITFAAHNIFLHEYANKTFLQIVQPLMF